MILNFFDIEEVRERNANKGKFILSAEGFQNIEEESGVFARELAKNSN